MGQRLFAWVKANPSSRTKTLTVRSELQWNGLEATQFMCWNDPFQGSSTLTIRGAIFTLSPAKQNLRATNVLSAVLEKNRKMYSKLILIKIILKIGSDIQKSIKFFLLCRFFLHLK